MMKHTDPFKETICELKEHFNETLAGLAKLETVFNQTEKIFTSKTKVELCNDSDALIQLTNRSQDLLDAQSGFTGPMNSSLEILNVLLKVNTLRAKNKGDVKNV